jgi:hypothetical protein
MVTRLMEVVGPIVALAKTFQDNPPGSLRPDITKVSREGVASVVLLGLMVSAMEDKLREGVESIVEVAKPYKGLAETLLKLSGVKYGAIASAEPGASGVSGAPSEAAPGKAPSGSKSGDIISLATSLYQLS